MNFYAIANATELFFAMKAKKEQYEKFEELAYNDLINTVKRTEQPLSTVIHCLESLGKDNRDDYVNFIESSLRELLGDESIKYEKSVQGGLDAYSYSIRFTSASCTGVTFDLSIPVYRNLNKNNFTDARDGKMGLGFFSPDDPILCNLIGMSYLTEDITKMYHNQVDELRDNEIHG